MSKAMPIKLLYLFILGSALASQAQAIGLCQDDKVAFCISSALPNITLEKKAEITRQDGLFGYQLVQYGETTLIAAPQENQNGFKQGAVFRYHKYQNPQALPWPDDLSNKSYFGSSLTVAGQTAAIGAPGLAQGKRIAAGALYIFDVTAPGTPVIQQMLTAASPTAGDFFGSAATFIDQDTILIGAHLADSTAVDAGAAYIFSKQQDGQWHVVQTLSPDTLKTGSLFGNAVVTANQRVVVGAYGHEASGPGSGAVFVFSQQNGAYKLEQTLTSPAKKAFAEYGRSLFAKDDWLVVGAPYEDQSMQQQGTVYIYRYDTATMRYNLVNTVTPQVDWPMGGRLGSNLAITTDNLLAISYGNKGAVLLPLTNQKQQTLLRLPSNTDDQNNDVVLHVASPSTLYVSQPGHAVYVFGLTTPTP